MIVTVLAVEGDQKTIRLKNRLEAEKYLKSAGFELDYPDENNGVTMYDEGMNRQGIAFIISERNVKWVDVE
ncbi:hypothetical protein BMT55_16695 [Listeria newyorkensis]|uniref:Uncharacterized protein n=1 Tax=Listeria newyorkensis TaxID=1497681 RepID=A0ABX4XJQ6_9LIST|nr:MULTISPECIES: hypothetical protein [Listeria]KGL45712.1 hypothetical protein EP58_03195 [Listeria newyorkensis]PNP86906.1 hypothetical protein BMT55_16695 [Listeria newyorkensis]RQW65288.1 hypothetical protein DUK53_17210 [Listeria sp. SHR_NRA_18]SQC55356.1 Uncharacterised protein [Listeria newyorkensis]